MTLHGELGRASKSKRELGGMTGAIFEICGEKLVGTGFGTGFVTGVVTGVVTGGAE